MAARLNNPPARPDSLRSRIRLYLLDNPGRYTASQIATALNPQAEDRTDWSQKVANQCARMSREGLLDRHRHAEKSMGPGVSYALPAQDHTVEQKR